MVRRSSRLAALRPPLEAWGFRPASARAAQQDYDDVLLSQDLQPILLDTVGLHGIGLGAICKSWAAVVAGRRAKEWNVLTLEPAKGIGAPDQFDHPLDVTSLPDGGLCVADTFNHELKIFSKEQGAAPRVIGNRGMGSGQFEYPFGVVCDGASLYVVDYNNNRIQKLRLAAGEDDEFVSRGLVHPHLQCVSCHAAAGSG